MTDLPVRLERRVDLPAPPATVWRYLATDDGWSTWWGPGSTIDARPGGRMLIVYPGGATAEGEVTEVDPPHRIQFTYGYDREDTPIPPGGSVVTLTLVEQPDGSTELTLAHDVGDDTTADLHQPGWRYQLGLFRNVVAHGTHGPGIADRIDRWHALWADPDVSARRTALADLLTDEAAVTEPAGRLQGPDDLNAYITQSQAHLPGGVRRIGAPMVDGDEALWDWEIVAGEHTVTGRSVARLAADGRFRAVTAFWADGPPGVPTSRV